MTRPILFVAVAAGLAALTAGPGPARAAESYDNCTGFIDSLPATITTQGTWCLRKDVSTNMTSGSAITINTNNVTLDCNHFKIGGLAAGLGTTAHGVSAASRFNATVRNCNIRGFYRGISFSGSGGGHLVEDNSFDGNTLVSISVTHAPGSTIRRNIIVDTGGSTVSTSVAVGIVAVGGVDILDNTVNGVAPTGTDANAYGIQTDTNGQGSISGNRIRGLASTGTGAPLGIWTNNSGRGVFFENIVQGPGPGVAGGVGVRCHTNAATARSNVILGFETGVLNCLNSSNSVNAN